MTTDTDELAALSRQLEELRARVAQLGVRIDTENGDGKILVLAAQVKKLNDKLSALSHRVDDVLAPKVAQVQAPSWLGLGADDYAAQLAALCTWVDGHLRQEYPGYRLADCWASHREALWELATIWAEWKRIYDPPVIDDQVPERDLNAALRWHRDYLPSVLARLDKSIPCDLAGCQLVIRQAQAPEHPS